MALLVALVSVLAFAIPIFVDALTPKDSRIQIAFQAMVKGKVYLVATNEGNRAGSVTAVYIKTVEAGGRGGQDGDMFVRDLKIQPTVILPGQSQQIAIPVLDDHLKMFDIVYWLGTLEQREPAFKIAFEAKYKNFASNDRSVTFEVPVDVALASSPYEWSECASQYAKGKTFSMPGLREVSVTRKFIREVCGKEPEWLLTAEAISTVQASPESD